MISRLNDDLSSGSDKKAIVIDWSSELCPLMVQDEMTLSGSIVAGNVW